MYQMGILPYLSYHHMHADITLVIHDVSSALELSVQGPNPSIQSNAHSLDSSTIHYVQFISMKSTYACIYACSLFCRCCAFVSKGRLVKLSQDELTELRLMCSSRVLFQKRV